MAADRWEFFLTAHGAWCWRRIDPSTHLVTTGPHCFDSRSACVADAMRHGYCEHAALLKPPRVLAPA